MTDTTQRVYEYILRFKREFDGLAPSLREICMVCGLSSTSQATYHLRRLEEQGKVLLLGGHASRGIMVVGGRWEISAAEKGPDGVRG